jgi:transglutaminase/protease-like cytokinesis protein 3
VKTRSCALLFAALAVHCGGVSAQAPAPATAQAAWPSPANLHPAVASMPASAETSVESVAAYLAQREQDPQALVKALHDWVADRMHYDYAKMDSPPRPGQFFWGQHEGSPDTSFSLSTWGPYAPDPGAAFQTRKGVCGDFASVLSALGKYAGIDIDYVTGYVRASDGDHYHAWNVAHVGGRSLPIDVTWDSQPYSTDYLFTPPQVFAFTHFADDSKKRLVSKPSALAEFDAQPIILPRFQALSLSLEAVYAKDGVRVVLDNPKQVALSAFLVPHGSHTPSRCEVHAGTHAVIECGLGATGEYAVYIFNDSSSLALIQVLSEA